MQRAHGLLPKNKIVYKFVRCMTKGDYGSGVSSGGGGGGSIREAGGKLGEMGAAREEEYFRKLTKVQLESLKKDHETEIDFHEESIKKHTEAIKRHKKKIKGIPEV